MVKTSWINEWRGRGDIQPESISQYLSRGPTQTAFKTLFLIAAHATICDILPFAVCLSLSLNNHLIWVCGQNGLQCVGIRSEETTRKQINKRMKAKARFHHLFVSNEKNYLIDLIDYYTKIVKFIIRQKY